MPVASRRHVQVIAVITNRIEFVDVAPDAPTPHLVGVRAGRIAGAGKVCDDPAVSCLSGRAAGRICAGCLGASSETVVRASGRIETSGAFATAVPAQRRNKAVARTHIIPSSSSLDQNWEHRCPDLLR